MANSGIIQTVPICEIEAYNRMDGFGIFVTIRVVGRAQLDDITQQEPYLTAVCREIEDSLPPNLELPNLVASNIENFMLMLSSMEHRLEQAKNKKGDDEEDEEMQKRIDIAKLVRQLVYCFLWASLSHHVINRRIAFTTRRPKATPPMTRMTKT